MIIDGEGIQAYQGVQIFDWGAMEPLQAVIICYEPLSDVEVTDMLVFSGL